MYLEKTSLSQATWIAPPSYDKDKIEVVYFRHTFSMDEPCQLKISLSANSRYRLWLNGESVGYGPCNGDRWYHYYDTMDVSHYVKEGTNVMVAKVVTYPAREGVDKDKTGPHKAFSNAAGPLFILSGKCVNKKGHTIHDVTTGHATWLCHQDTATTWHAYPYTFWLGASQETVEGIKVPLDFKGLSIHQEQWHDTIIKHDQGSMPHGVFPSFYLEERPIPFMQEEKGTFVKEMPIKLNDTPAFSMNRGDTIPPFSKRVMEVDAGELVTGFFHLSTIHGSDAMVKILYSESYILSENGFEQVKGIRDDCVNGHLRGYVDTFYPSGNHDHFETFWYRVFRYVRIEVETKEQPLELSDIHYVKTGYPLKEHSHVTSNEAWINQLWDMALRTLKNNMHEYYSDGPYYEQLQYTLDSLLESLFVFSVSEDTGLPKKAIMDFQQSLLPEGILQCSYPSDKIQVIPSFALYWIKMVHDYYWQTADKALVKRLRATIDTILDWYDRRIGSLGLIENIGHWEFIDWVEGWDTGVPNACQYGPSTAHNFLYAYSLRVAAELMEVAERPYVAKEYHRRADAIIAQLNIYCWVNESGMYKEGPTSDTYSQHAQLFAVLAQAKEGQEAKKMLTTALHTDSIFKCSFPLTFFMFRALEKAGIYHETEKLWDMWKCLLDLNLTTIPERPFRQRSDSHGWSALPLYEYTRSFLGVRPAVPGWDVITVDPICSYVKNIEGSVSTPKGTVHVKIQDGKIVALLGPKGVTIDCPQYEGEHHV
ncbi:hypothetical protein HZI73_01415 [Vallitalea pronyensis]|uniref:Alpha-L-rhamnosidase six-hairpin glycosidase domain-containing protein n=1 Tax=Vallitalea pronyensis TaxID=1348613 RepID=A0A8J8MGR9_9FIRM|nr:hypothetical protein [Vallitalea pronyensis]QUI21033.1 hypothetical protein HZI73_01415 [Vallitalea pronyensis]